MALIRYLATMPASRTILWCYTIWWAVMVGYYFRPDVQLWLTSAGIAVIVGIALMLSTGPLTRARFRERFWESMRLFIIPFMVSSFSGLVTGNSFWLVFSSRWMENAVAAGSVAIFLLLVRIVQIVFDRGAQ